MMTAQRSQRPSSHPLASFVASGVFSLMLSVTALAAPRVKRASTEPLSCAALSVRGVDASLARKPYQSAMGFAHQLEQLRFAVKTFHGETYSDAMTIEDANALGEGVVFSTVRVLDGKRYQGVNVGFGGGNSALYLFAFDTLELAPVVIIDGVDCVALGTETQGN
jgi:hypothetical protein